LLLLHGIGRSLEDWLPQHDRLSGSHRVLSVDMPGFGLSDRLDEPLKVAARPEHARVFLETAKSLGSFRGIRPAWRSELVTQVAELRKPTLVVWGERDLILPSTHLAAARTLLPHAESHLFPGTGHLPQIDAPTTSPPCADDFAALVQSFLAVRSQKS